MSNPRLDASLVARHQSWIELLRPVFFCLVLMSLSRFITYWAISEDFTGVDEMNIIAAFVTGVRFDALVWGFFLIPVVLLSQLSIFVPRTWTQLVGLIRFYLMCVWTLVAAALLVDEFFFAFHHRHWTWTDLQAGDFSFLTEASQRWGGLTLSLLLAIRVLVGIGGVRGFFQWQASSEMESGSLSWDKRLGLWVWPLLLVALAARGTVTAHHLGMEHSEVSAHPWVNQLSLNVVWAFDKTVDQP